MSSGFVQPDVVRVELTGGNYLLVKRELSAGEERRVFARCIKSMRAGEKMEIDPEQVGKTKLLEYITAWGGPAFTTAAGAVRAFSASALDDLRPSLFNAIMQAVETHEQTEAKRRDEEKNDQGEIGKLEAISPSVN